jgi:3,4-dihydroxy 2-butanone 4-phosphate synthase/GTP cyclohydrolase II
MAEAVARMRSGRLVLIADDDSAAGYLVLAGRAATTAEVAFMVRHTSGFLEAALPASTCDRLMLPPMWGSGTGTGVSQYAVSVDLAHSGGTGISSADRAATVRTLSDPAATHLDFARPGHVMPRRIAEIAYAAVAPFDIGAAVSVLAARSTGSPVGLLAAVVSQDRPTELADAAELMKFGAAHGIPVVTSMAVAVTRKWATATA